MPVLTAVARIIDNELTPTKAVLELMNLPQVRHLISQAQPSDPCSILNCCVWLVTSHFF